MLRVIIAAPFLLIFVLFALSNTQTVQLGIWPTDYSLQAPLSVIILVAMAIAFLIGATLTWAAALGARLRARRAEHTISTLEAQIETLRDTKPRQATPAPTAALAPPRA
jgi:uncharacterized integral membrane protein